MSAEGHSHPLARPVTELAPTTNLCDICKQIPRSFFEQDKSHYTHRTHDDLSLSAATCLLCATINERLVAGNTLPGQTLFPIGIANPFAF